MQRLHHRIRSPGLLRCFHSYTGKSYLSNLPTWAASQRNKSHKQNIFILGPPGSGKSSVVKHLSQLNGMTTLDVDDDFLEKNWNCSVADKLKELGDDAFLEAEGAEMMRLDVENTIVSLSGSNPLHPKSLHKLAQSGTIVYLDTKKEDILARCHIMKVDRIVGQSTKSLSSILDTRANIYENSYDLRVNADTGSTPEQIATKIHQTVTRSEDFVSTRGYDNNVDFVDAVKRGLAPDRGLFIPKSYIEFTKQELVRLQGLSYPELALRVIEKFPLGSLHPSSLRQLLHEAYSTFSHDQVLPVTLLHDNFYLMETYHGPTASFKDLSLQLLPKLMHTASQIRPSKTDSTTALLVATSGDTGTAALDGFTRIPNTPVIVLYPENGVSEIQRAQMQTCESNNACVIGIEGDFDFCQSTVKDIFNDKALNDGFAKILPGLHLSSANSINWGRLLPQIVFAVNSYTKLVEQGVIKVGEEFDLCIPTGNFGNMLGAVFAKRLGLPIRQLITASNENNIISDFLRTGEYDIRTRKFRATISPSIDILISSNLERFLYLLSDGDSKLISKLFTQLSNEGHFKVDGALLKKINETVIGDWCNEEECMRTIRETYETTKRLIDPHTAVAVAVSKRYKQDSTPIVVASTAHSGKFPSTMLKALQVDTLPEDAKDKHHPEIENLKNKPTKQPTVLPANKEQVISTIRKFLKQYK